MYSLHSCMYMFATSVRGLALDHSILGVFTAGWKVLLSFIQTALKWH